MNETIQQFLSGKQVVAPFDVEVDGALYHCAQVLRLLPGRRLVVKALHQGQPLLLKLLVPNKKGWRELSREQHGYKLCTQAGISVPKERFISDSFAGCLAVAYEFIEDADAFSLEKGNHAQQIPALLEMMVSCHQGGIYQQDIHTDNILLSPQGLYLIDVASVRGLSGQPLPMKPSLKNLARLFAQFVPDQQLYLMEKLSLYYRARGWEYNREARAAFRGLLDKAWHKRKDDYLSKCFRPCTMTVYGKNKDREYAFKRHFFKLVGEQLVVDIDRLVEQGDILKDGNSATVVVTNLAGRRVVIKRYNVKSLWHWLKRCWRPSRAANAWRQGNLMTLLGIATPPVLGFVEHRWGPLRKQAYLISEYVDNATELSRVYASHSPSEPQLRQLRRIFGLMHEYRLSHGDMKASNLLLTENGQVALIDLDAMREHRHDWSFERAFARDQRRFLRNWQNKALRARFESMMKTVSQ
ncbi:lipopolysaccharide kinase InaA family protein [uncultured Methylophaga sp.]|uniref:lipopolysaccharide kinase InaA family protein n=1 Tax=uncultured Methylophaga sp. TaxID=285271 RepID=UPI002622E8F7|nr:lipopolysaccharide kinase InaA family protein [uncultured Methylophaga sp.]